MHSSYFLSALAAAASVTLVSATASPILGDLVDINAPIAAIAPILNNANIEILDKKKRGLPSLIDVDAPIAVVAPVLNNLDLEILDLKKKRGIDINVGLNVEVAIKVDNLVKGVLKTLEPVFELIEDTVKHADDLTDAELSSILAAAFGKIHKATSGLSSSLLHTGAGFEKRTRGSNADLTERALLSNEEVAETLSVLLNKVAGVVNLAEGLLGNLPILGGILIPLFGQINGDLSLILSSVGNLLVGVVSLVNNLLDGVAGTVTGLPILGSLVGGLLGGLL